MDDFNIENALNNSKEKEPIQISELCMKRLENLTVISKHTKIRRVILLSRIIFTVLLIISVPTTVYGVSKVSDALQSKIKDANLNTNQINKLYNNLKQDGFSESAIENLDILSVNEYGITFGPDALGADLIKVISDGGIEGYVYRDELYPEKKIKTPEEAIKDQIDNLEGRVIPVYKSDGKTVIGNFTIEDVDKTAFKVGN